MKKTTFVDRLQTQSDAQGHRSRSRGLERSASRIRMKSFVAVTGLVVVDGTVAQTMVQRNGAVDELRDQIRVLQLFTVIVQPDHIRMIRQAGHGLGLPPHGLVLAASRLADAALENDLSTHACLPGGIGNPPARLT